MMLRLSLLVVVAVVCAVPIPHSPGLLEKNVHHKHKKTQRNNMASALTDEPPLLCRGMAAGGGLLLRTKTGSSFEKRKVSLAELALNYEVMAADRGLLMVVTMFDSNEKNIKMSGLVSVNQDPFRSVEEDRLRNELDLLISQKMVLKNSIPQDATALAAKRAEEKSKTDELVTLLKRVSEGELVKYRLNLIGHSDEAAGGVQQRGKDRNGKRVYIKGHGAVSPEQAPQYMEFELKKFQITEFKKCIEIHRGAVKYFCDDMYVNHDPPWPQDIFECPMNPHRCAASKANAGLGGVCNKTPFRAPVPVDGSACVIEGGKPGKVTKAKTGYPRKDNTPCRQGYECCLPTTPPTPKQAVMPITTVSQRTYQTTKKQNMIPLAANNIFSFVYGEGGFFRPPSMDMRTNVAGYPGGAEFTFSAEPNAQVGCSGLITCACVIYWYGDKGGIGNAAIGSYHANAGVLRDEGLPNKIVGSQGYNMAAVVALWVTGPNSADDDKWQTETAKIKAAGVPENNIFVWKARSGFVIGKATGEFGGI